MIVEGIDLDAAAPQSADGAEGGIVVGSKNNCCRFHEIPPDIKLWL